MRRKSNENIFLYHCFGSFFPYEEKYKFLGSLVAIIAIVIRHLHDREGEHFGVVVLQYDDKILPFLF